MKRSLLLLFFLTFLFKVYAQFSQQINPDKNFSENISKEESKKYLARLSNIESRAGNNYDLRYHRFELEIDPDTLYIKGAVTSYFKITEENAKIISFDLSDKLSIDSVTYHRNKASFTFSSNILDITVPALNMNSFDSVTVYYHGSPSSTGFGSFVKGTHADGPVIWTLSEPYGASDWWPCKQGLNDKIDSIDIFVKTPAKNRVASNGLLISEKEIGGKKTFHWKHRYPISTYLIGIAVTNYAVYSDFVPFKEDTLEVLNYVYPSSLEDAKKITSDVIPVMQIYDSLFGAYPFMKEKYGHAQFGWGGGMEHQTMSFMGGFSHELIAHELAHQWFGDKITCASWSDIWLNEGFATFLTGLTYEHMFDQFFWPRWKQLEINSIISKPDGSVFRTDTSTSAIIFDGRLSYSKGAMVLHMLRGVLGDSAFFKGVNNYLNDPMLKYNFAKTTHLIHHFESASGKNLAEFFNDWYYGEGYPTYDIQWTQSSDNNIQLSLDQTTSHSSVSFYEMPVPVLFKNSTQDTTIKIQHNFSGEIFSFNPGFQADSVIVDPENWIVKGKSSVALGLADEEQSFGIKIYPNPSTDIVNVNSPYALSELKIYTLVGVLIENKKVQKINNFKLDFSEYENGLYFVEIISERGSSTFKIVKN